MGKALIVGPEHGDFIMTVPIARAGGKIRIKQPLLFAFTKARRAAPEELLVFGGSLEQFNESWR